MPTGTGRGKDNDDPGAMGNSIPGVGYLEVETINGKPRPGIFKPFILAGLGGRVDPGDEVNFELHNCQTQVGSQKLKLWIAEITEITKKATAKS